MRLPLYLCANYCHYLVTRLPICRSQSWGNSRHWRMLPSRQKGARRYQSCGHQALEPASIHSQYARNKSRLIFWDKTFAYPDCCIDRFLFERTGTPFSPPQELPCPPRTRVIKNPIFLLCIVCLAPSSDAALLYQSNLFPLSTTSVV